MEPKRGRPGRTENQDRHAITPGIENRHRGVHQSDVTMQRHRHRLLGDLRIAMSHRYRMFFMQSEQNLRPFIAEIVRQAVVKAAINSILGQGR